MTPIGTCGWAAQSWYHHFVLLHCLQRFDAAVTLQHLPGKQCWDNQRGMLCRHCGHLGINGRNEALNRTFGVIYNKPKKVLPTPKSKVIPKKRPADIAIRTTVNETLDSSAYNGLACGRPEACANTTTGRRYPDQDIVHPVAQSPERKRQKMQTTAFASGSCKLLALRKVLRSCLGVCGTDANIGEMRWKWLELSLTWWDSTIKTFCLEDRHLPCFQSKQDGLVDVIPQDQHIAVQDVRSHAQAYVKEAPTFQQTSEPVAGISASSEERHATRPCRDRAGLSARSKGERRKRAYARRGRGQAYVIAATGRGNRCHPPGTN